MHPELSPVSCTPLGRLETNGGCRATDLAAHYAPDESTLSRRVAAPERCDAWSAPGEHWAGGPAGARAVARTPYG
ncbi:hypothetical protein SUDANB176_00849 [Streptomyces sp. enrichment culture]